ncbi:sialidase family protein [Flavobacterium pallidum]|uniref:Oxidoreductase n=1 Tax=Flavobacterium pallidum TaxID=2172098 RepID=A0A2S1SJW4_9FLAO|nr:oxidoreductase [Flavobacterium pallidum]AWI26652.1 oxidoreductase [Flavobacterium pallidum]
MKKFLIITLSASFLICCKKDPAENPKADNAIERIFASADVDTITADSMSIRAILIDKDKLWYAANDGKYGFYDLSRGKMFNGHIALDSLKPEFRSISKTAENIFILNVGSPALLYKISKDGRQAKIVYRENDPKAFYDSMQFFNDKGGIAMGDPTGNCLSVITTTDGGDSWKKILCDKLPAITEGEAAFAASNTNLIVKGSNIWMVSGGKKSRLFHSPDKGKTWNVYNTPIVQGKVMTGIFTADFYDDNNGFIAGGDYEIPGQNHGNKAITSDGGKNWKLVAENKGFGYASCVQYVPGSHAKQLVCVGPSGLQYSSDSGNNWKQLLKDKDLYTIRFQNDSVAFAAGRNKIVRVRFK